METSKISKQGNWLFDEDSFVNEFNETGSVIIENVLEGSFIERIKEELKLALEKEVQYHGTTDYSFYGYVLVNAKYGGAFLELFDNEKIVKPINAILGKGSIAYSYTSSSMPPEKGNDSSHIHVDSPIYIPNYILRMGVIIPLTDFTVDNGATYYLPYSHLKEEQPEEAEFYKNAKRLTIKAGSAWFFNTRLWHAGGTNSTNDWRHAITLNMCRPWMKQRVDIPGIMEGMDLTNVSESTLQKLGFYSQIPKSYDEYWAPPEKRKFRQVSV
ncbi:MAG: phytanoyl-CoA dioxygenase family protein [Reichenbachiella sp.]|uniref:phytanoyl-CoA dioxygenase family protein n=1 Tax=Reichenbachiella sp. TaxID=2184521 RepID=UPI0032675205